MRPVPALAAPRASISVVIIAQNEEHCLRDCIRSFAGLATEVVLVDGGSQDATPTVANLAILEHPVPPVLRLFQRPFDNAARQMNFGIQRASGAWILLLDCDERLSPQLHRQLSQLPLDATTTVGYYFPRQNIVFGRWLRHGGNYPDYNSARLFRRGFGLFEDQPVHAQLRLRGAAEHLEAPLVHHSYRDLHDYLRKFNSYTGREAERMAAAGRRFSFSRMVLESVGHLAQRGLRQAAFRDGASGLIYLFLGFFYDLVRHLKLRELASKEPHAYRP